MIERLPSGWVSTRLDGVLAEGLVNGRSVPTAESGFPVLRLTALNGGRIDLSERKIGKWQREDAEKYLVRGGDFLVSRGNGSIRLVGRGGIVPCDDEVAFPDTMIRVRPETRTISPEFLRYQWHGLRVRAQIEKSAKTTAGIHKVSQGDLNKVNLVLAPLPEQYRIVAEIEKQFTRLDAAVANLERVKANLKRARASVLKAAVEGRLVPTEAELARAEGRDYEPASVLLERILGARRENWERAERAKLRSRETEPTNEKWKRGYSDPAEPAKTGRLPPEGWTWASLDQLAYFTVDYRGKTPPMSDAGVPVISAANVKRGRIVLEPTRYISPEVYKDHAVRGLPEAGDLVVTTEAPVGACAIYPEGGPYQLTRRVIGFQTVEVANQYLMAAFSGEVARLHIKANNRGTTVPRILKPALLATPIALPPLTEQRRIAAEIDRRFSVFDALERTVEANLARCARLRQSILKCAFEGRLVPQDPNDEPASELLARIQAESEAAKPKRTKKKSTRKKAAKKQATRKKKTTE